LRAPGEEGTGRAWSVPVVVVLRWEKKWVTMLESGKRRTMSRRWTVTAVRGRCRWMVELRMLLMIWVKFLSFCFQCIVARFGIDAAFRDPGSIDPDRGSGT
jgi:hypothetical protein